MEYLITIVILGLIAYAVGRTIDIRKLEAENRALREGKQNIIGINNQLKAHLKRLGFYVNCNNELKRNKKEK